MTTSTQLMARVRSNIYETTGATGELSRTDAEIYAWLDESQYDYVAKLPKDAFPELIVEAAVASWPWTIPTGFSELIEAIVTHTVGAAPFAEVAYLLGHGESYLRLNQGATTLGAWVQIRGATIDAGPSPLSGVIKYFRIPAPINIAGLTLELGTEHEGPIIDRATAHALQKINDEDAAFYLASYEKRVAAEIGKSNGGK
jgi:hypothetical protein